MEREFINSPVQELEQGFLGTRSIAIFSCIVLGYVCDVNECRSDVYYSYENNRDFWEHGPLQFFHVSYSDMYVM